MNKSNLGVIKDTLQSYWLFFIPHHLFSRFTYIITRTQHPLTKYLIELYISMFKINLKECERETVDEYKTFCDFFTRKLKDGIHKIDEDKKSVVSSCDGKILEYGKIKNNSILQVKGKYILIEDLLGNNNDSIDHYKNGSFVTIYLSPKDYHRVHMPMTGKLSMTTYVPGRLYSVALHAVNTIKNLYSRNERLVCSFKNNNIYFTVVFIAAINVSSIETVWSGEVSPPAPKKIIKSNFEKRKINLDKGRELGMFKSGSTVVLLFDDKIKLSTKLKKGKAVRVGNKIGEIIS
mgnify:CR=1 FL=1